MEFRVLDLIDLKKSKNEIVSELNITDDEFYKIIVKLREDYGIEFYRNYYSNGDIRYFKVRTNGKKIQRLKIDTKLNILPTDHDSITMMYISDVHLGNESSNLKRLEMVYDYCLQHNIHIVLNSGDFVDGTFGQGSKLSLYEQVENLVKNYPRDKSIATLSVLGDHDYSLLEKYGINLIKIFENRRHDIFAINFHEGIIRMKDDSIALRHRIDSSNIYVKDDFEFYTGGRYAFIGNGHFHRNTVFNNYNQVIVNASSISDINFNKGDGIFPNAYLVTFNFDREIIDNIVLEEVLFDNKFNVLKRFSIPVSYDSLVQYNEEVLVDNINDTVNEEDLKDIECETVEENVDIPEDVEMNTVSYEEDDDDEVIDNTSDYIYEHSSQDSEYIENNDTLDEVSLSYYDKEQSELPASSKDSLDNSDSDIVVETLVEPEYEETEEELLKQFTEDTLKESRRSELNTYITDNYNIKRSCDIETFTALVYEVIEDISLANTLIERMQEHNKMILEQNRLNRIISLLNNNSEQKDLLKVLKQVISVSSKKSDEILEYRNNLRELLIDDSYEKLSDEEILELLHCILDDYVNSLIHEQVTSVEQGDTFAKIGVIKDSRGKPYIESDIENSDGKYKYAQRTIEFLTKLSNGEITSAEVLGGINLGCTKYRAYYGEYSYVYTMVGNNYILWGTWPKTQGIREVNARWQDPRNIRQLEQYKRDENLESSLKFPKKKNK